MKLNRKLLDYPLKIRGKVRLEYWCAGLLAFVLVMAGLLIVGLGQGVQAQGSTPPSTTDIVCNQLTENNIACNKDTTFANSLLGKVVNILIYIVGAVSVVIVVIGGLMYVLSAGDPNNTKRAKDAILFALVGLAVAIFGRVIVLFVVGRL